MDVVALVLYISVGSYDRRIDVPDDVHDDVVAGIGRGTINDKRRMAGSV